MRTAIRIRAFPRNAVTDRKEFNFERSVNWPCSPRAKFDGHNSWLTVFCCPSPVTVSIAILIAIHRRLTASWNS